MSSYKEMTQVVAARYDAATGRMVLEMQNDVVVEYPARSLRGFESATDEALADVQVVGGGSELQWPQIDEGIEMMVLIPRLFNIVTARDSAARAGATKSAAKAAAARANGAKSGGRPRKKPL